MASPTRNTSSTPVKPPSDCPDGWGKELITTGCRVYLSGAAVKLCGRHISRAPPAALAYYIAPRLMLAGGALATCGAVGEGLDKIRTKPYVKKPYILPPETYPGRQKADLAARAGMGLGAGTFLAGITWFYAGAVHAGAARTFVSVGQPLIVRGVALGTAIMVNHLVVDTALDVCYSHRASKKP